SLRLVAIRTENRYEGKRSGGSFKRVEGRSSNQALLSQPVPFSSAFQAGNFLIDSGSPLTIIPATAEDAKKPRSDTGLLCASGEKIFSYGRRPVEIPINKELFHYQASICNVVRPILGRDFFQGPGKDLLLDISKQKLINRYSNLPVAEAPSGNDHANVVAALDSCNGSVSLDPTAPTFHTFSQLENFRKSADLAIKNFVEFMGPDKGKAPALFSPIRIDTGDNAPVFSKSRPLLGEKAEFARKKLEELTSQGIIEE
ncbi:Retrovirus-related Pol poly, partial [Paramuricea clavata]